MGRFQDGDRIVVNTQHVPYSVATLGRASRSTARSQHHTGAQQRSSSANTTGRNRGQEFRMYNTSDGRSKTPSSSRPGTFGRAQGDALQEHIAKNNNNIEIDDPIAVSSRDGNWIAKNEAILKAGNSLAFRNEQKARQMAASMEEELRRERENRNRPPSPASSGYSVSRGVPTQPQTPSRIISGPPGVARAQSPGGPLPNGGVAYTPHGTMQRVVHVQGQHHSRQMTRMVHPSSPTRVVLNAPHQQVLHHPQQTVILNSRPPSPSYHKVAPAHAMAIARATSPGYGMTLTRKPSPHEKYYSPQQQYVRQTSASPQGRLVVHSPRQVLVQRNHSGPSQPQVVYVTDPRLVRQQQQQHHVIQGQGHMTQMTSSVTPQGRYVRARSGSGSSSSSGQRYRNPLLREKKPQPAGGYALGARNRSSSVPDIFMELNAQDYIPQTLPRNFGAQPAMSTPVYHSSTVPRKTKTNVYRGEFVRIAVPRYKMEEDMRQETVMAGNNRNSLLMSQTYHSEPNLLDLLNEEEDKEISMRLSLLPADEGSPAGGKGGYHQQLQQQLQHGYRGNFQQGGLQVQQPVWSVPDTHRTPQAIPKTPTSPPANMSHRHGMQTFLYDEASSKFTQSVPPTPMSPTSPISFTTTIPPTPNSPSTPSTLRNSPAATPPADGRPSSVPTPPASVISSAISYASNVTEWWVSQ